MSKVLTTEEIVEATRGMNDEQYRQFVRDELRRTVDEREKFGTAKFTDALGRVWPLSFTVTSFKRVLDDTGINLCDVFDGKSLAVLSNDPFVFVSVLYALIRPEALRLGLSPEDVGDGLSGDALQAAYDAVIQGIANFPRSAMEREAIAKMNTTGEAARQEAAKRAVKIIESDTMKSKVAELLNSGERQAMDALSQLGS